MIPQRVHYCWFGPRPLPVETQRYIASWQQYLPGFEFKLWNEHNFDVNALAYSRAAYAAGQYAFVADVCRIQALLHEGGIYLDTDVQLVASLTPFLQHRCFTGFEEGMNPYSGELTCQPQAGVMGCEAGSALMQDIWQYYQQAQFEPAAPVTINRIFRRIYEEHGVVFNNQFQQLADYVSIYPSDYFMAKNAYTHELTVTSRTVCIHHYDGSWLTEHRWLNQCKRWLLSLLRRGLGAQRTKQLIDWLKQRCR